MPEINRTVLEVTNFQKQVLDASHQQPVLVDFYATWCGPCKAFKPVLEKFAATWTKGLVVSVDTDKYDDAANAFKVQSVPTFVLIKDGVALSSQIGAPPRAIFEKWVADSLK